MKLQQPDISKRTMFVVGPRPAVVKAAGKIVAQPGQTLAVHSEHGKHIEVEAFDAAGGLLFRGWMLKKYAQRLAKAPPAWMGFGPSFNYRQHLLRALAESEDDIANGRYIVVTPEQHLKSIGLEWMAYALRITDSYRRQERHFLTRHPELASKYTQILKQLVADPWAPSLRLHKLKGALAKQYAVSITQSYRMTLTLVIAEHEVIPMAIGSHDVVYWNFEIEGTTLLRIAGDGAVLPSWGGYALPQEAGLLDHANERNLTPLTAAQVSL